MIWHGMPVLYFIKHKSTWPISQDKKRDFHANFVIYTAKKSFFCFLRPQICEIRYEKLILSFTFCLMVVK